jgi:hypothetical protein
LHPELYAALQKTVFGLAQVRSPWRAAALVQLALVALAALGVDELDSVLRARGPRFRRTGMAAAVTLTALATLESWPPAPNLTKTPDLSEWQGFGRWARNHVTREDALLHLPMPPERTGSGFEVSARAMLLATTHGRPIANGYASYFPDDHRRLDRVMDHFPDADSTALLQQLGIRYAAFERDWSGPGGITTAERRRMEQLGWQKVRTFPEAGAVVYRRPDVGSTPTRHPGQ